MKVLVDSSVWSLMLRRRNRTLLSKAESLLRASLEEAIDDGRVAIIGPIRQEVLSGIRDATQFLKLRSGLRAFRDEPITSLQFEEAARFFNLCRMRGVECGATDILICSVAAEKQWAILTNDSGLARCIQLLRSEGIKL